MNIKLQILSYLFPYACFFQNIGRKGCENQLMAPSKRNLLPPLDPNRSNFWFRFGKPGNFHPPQKVMTRPEKRRLPLKTNNQWPKWIFRDAAIVVSGAASTVYVAGGNLPEPWMAPPEWPYGLDLPIFFIFRCLKQRLKWEKTSQTSKDRFFFFWGKWSCHTTYHKQVLLVEKHHGL